MNRPTPIELRLAETTRYTLLTHIKWNKIALIYPIQQHNGRSACRVYYVDGTYDEAANTCATVLEHLAREHFTKPENARVLNNSCDWHTRKRCVTMLLSETCTIVPVIAIETRQGRKSRMGYLVKQHLYDTEPLPDGTLLRFGKDHAGVRIAQKEESLRQKLLEAMMLEQYYAGKLTEMRRQILAQQGASYDGRQIGRYR